MTSANSSLVKFIREQKALLWRRLPLAALSIIMYFLYDVFGTVMLIQRERVYAFSDQPFAVRGASVISGLMGLRSLSWLIGCTGAVLLAIQGFAYLYKMQTVDFYESRPEKRSTRFFNIIINSLLIYLIPSLLGVILSICIAAANGCAPGWLVLEMFISLGLQTVLFLAVYGMSVLASLLTGTVVTAVMMNLFLFGLEGMIRLTILGYRGAYYATFDQGKSDGLLNNIYTLPAFNYLGGIIRSMIFAINEYSFTGSYDYVMRSVGFTTKGTIVNLILFVVSIVLSYIVYKKRKAESAGNAVIYRPLEVFIKFVTGVIISLDAGLLINAIFNVDKNSGTGPVIITIILMAFLISLILESVFALNVRMAFNKAWQIPIIAVISIIILFIYKSGITGYDRFLPAKEKVASSYLVNYNYNPDYYEDTEEYESSFIPTAEFVEKNMFLTDTDDVLSLAAIGQSDAVNRMKIEDADDIDEGCWEAVIGWRMKDGSIITRRLTIPEDIDPVLMDSITGREEFTKGVYQMDNVLPIIDSKRNSSKNYKLTMSVSTEHGYLETGEDLTEGFLNAYRKDLGEHYDFSMASNNNPVGSISVYDNSYFSISWPIYDCYDDTIAFLKEHDMWHGGFLESGEVVKINVSRTEYIEETGEYINDSEEYTEADKIKEIMEASISNTYSSAWPRSTVFESGDYSIEIYPDEASQTDYSHSTCYYRTFYKDKIPGFVPKKQ